MSSELKYNLSRTTMSHLNKRTGSKPDKTLNAATSDIQWNVVIVVAIMAVLAWTATRGSHVRGQRASLAASETEMITLKHQLYGAQAELNSTRLGAILAQEAAEERVRKEIKELAERSRQELSVVLTRAREEAREEIRRAQTEHLERIRAEVARARAEMKHDEAFRASMGLQWGPFAKAGDLLHTARLSSILPAPYGYDKREVCTKTHAPVEAPVSGPPSWCLNNESVSTRHSMMTSLLTGYIIQKGLWGYWNAGDAQNANL
jgi:F0F1-type ATP synthase membrane subunit b/b'